MTVDFPNWEFAMSLFEDNPDIDEQDLVIFRLIVGTVRIFES
jgi:hypothetical protein